MKLRILFTLLIISFSPLAHAQLIATIPDNMVMPEPTYSVHKFLRKNLKYPKDAYAKKIEGQVKFFFIVDKEGNIKDVRPKDTTGVYPSLVKEAVRVVSLFPPWKPGTKDGEPMEMYYTLPINFKYSN